MPEHRSFKKNVIQFFYSIGLPPKRLMQGAIALLILGAVTAALFFVNLDGFGKGKQPETSASTETGSSNEFDIGIDQQINELTFFNPGRMAYTEAYGETQKHNEKIAELRKRDDITPEMVKKLDSMELRNLETLVLRSMKAGVDADNEMEAFVNFAESLLDTDDEQVKDSTCLLYTSPSPRDKRQSRMPSSA